VVGGQHGEELTEEDCAKEQSEDPCEDMALLDCSTASKE